MDLQHDIEKILLSEAELDAIVEGLAVRISRDYADKKLLLIGILKGSQIDFMKVSSYGSGTQSSGNLKITLDLLRNDLDKTDILVVEDIIDSGKTLDALTKMLASRGARSIRTCTLLDKPSRREVAFTPDYIGAEIPDEFVVGYGLDYDEDYRTLPVVGILKKEIYQK